MQGPCRTAGRSSCQCLALLFQPPMLVLLEPPSKWSPCFTFGLLVKTLFNCYSFQPPMLALLEPPSKYSPYFTVLQNPVLKQDKKMNRSQCPKARSSSISKYEADDGWILETHFGPLRLSSLRIDLPFPNTGTNAEAGFS